MDLSIGRFFMIGRGLFRRRKVTREVWCRDRRHIAVVNFAERTRDGLTTRQVRRCSLLEHGEACGEGCRYLPFETSASDVEPTAATRLAG
jgi:hypothetical protein